MLCIFIYVSKNKVQRQRHTRRSAHDGDVTNSITVLNLCCDTYRQACPLWS